MCQTSWENNVDAPAVLLTEGVPPHHVVKDANPSQYNALRPQESGEVHHKDRRRCLKRLSLKSVRLSRKMVNGLCESQSLRLQFRSRYAGFQQMVAAEESQKATVVQGSVSTNFEMLNNFRRWTPRIPHRRHR